MPSSRHSAFALPQTVTVSPSMFSSSTSSSCESAQVVNSLGLIAQWPSPSISMHDISKASHTAWLSHAIPAVHPLSCAMQYVSSLHAAASPTQRLSSQLRPMSAPPA